tara:strand:+ start:11953 stop:12678 length:726 start_codon:yes stop_codon:yes gene_type:complete
MKIGIVITMYDEHDLVLQTVKEVKQHSPEAKVVLVHSDNNKETDSLKELRKITEYLLLPDMSEEINKLQTTNPVIIRNFNAGFSKLYDLSEDCDLIVGLTGDTLITDASSFARRHTDMISNNFVAMVSQAVGQKFHAQAENGSIIKEGRYQLNSTTDFACCLFFLDGPWSTKNKLFTNIETTNLWTNEQCMGDELKKFLNNTLFYKAVGRLNWLYPQLAYSYNDGVLYHAKHNGIPAGRNK